MFHPLGWAGFAFPILDTPLGMHRTLDYSPRKKVSLEINGNTGMSPNNRSSRL
jgi:hypothetical protein